MANTAIDLTTNTGITGTPGGILVTITDANKALRITVGAARCKITMQPKTTAAYLIWDDSVATDATVSAANHLEVPAASAPSFICGGAGAAGPHNRSTGFAIASATAGQTVWIGVEEIG